VRWKFGIPCGQQSGLQPPLKPHATGAAAKVFRWCSTPENREHQRWRIPPSSLLTDRNDLDDQLFDTFSLCKELLRQRPVQADSKGHLRAQLKVASGVVFTTTEVFPDKERGSVTRSNVTGRDASEHS
jgi:hypothetical protein